MSTAVLEYVSLPARKRREPELPKVGPRDALDLVLRHRNGTESVVHVPDEASQFLLRALSFLLEGKTVAVVEEERELSPAQAAQLLGISRPLVVRRMDAGDLPFKYVGAHRRCLLRDVMRLKGQMDQESQTMRALAMDAHDLAEKHDL